MFGFFIWIPKLSVQSPLVCEVPQLSGPSRFPRTFCGFLYPVLKSAISLRIHASSDGKCIQKLHVRPQNSHCYQAVIACRLYIGQSRKNTFSLKNRIKMNISCWYKRFKTVGFELNFFMLCVNLFFQPLKGLLQNINYCLAFTF